MDEAVSEEAAESSQQQQCILSGEVHLRHRLEKQTTLENSFCSLFPHKYYAPSG
jgi:hypothetical protein